MSQAPNGNGIIFLPGQKGFWRQLHNSMLAALDDGTFMRFDGYIVSGRTFNYRSLGDFIKILEWVKGQADLEDGVPSYRGRTYAGQRGRG
ncbi:MAG: hypothetical protein FWG17_03095 [Desulfovibrionaceae bacterium]|nr:hypothetical protein [Desulfovibrionaceae bacterium]